MDHDNGKSGADALRADSEPRRQRFLGQSESGIDSWTHLSNRVWSFAGGDGLNLALACSPTGRRGILRVHHAVGRCLSRMDAGSREAHSAYDHRRWHNHYSGNHSRSRFAPPKEIESHFTDVRSTT